MDIPEILSKMTLEDKIALCSGADFWNTKQMDAYGIPALTMADGPHGLRCQKGEPDMVGVHRSQPATCFPTAVTSGATWNPELMAEEGEAIGHEGLAEGVSLILGPGCNIKRHPLAGRNFEYLSEDPLHAGKMAAAHIRGLQRAGASASLKHFAANNQEFKRMNGDSRVDERALREIYLAPFEMAIREGQPDTVMCAYNKLNGIHCSDNRTLLTDILRGEWGFTGAVVTDWGAMNDRISGFRAGCDLNMPGGSGFMERAVAEAVRKGTLKEADVDASAHRVLSLVTKTRPAPVASVDVDAHHALACRIAEQGAVLLKNEDHLLPLSADDITLFGHMAKQIRYQGTGSSHIHPTRLEHPVDCLPEAAFFPCCDAMGNVTEEALAQAAREACNRRIAVVVAGLPDAYETEALDREDMSLPAGHNRMIEAIASANPNTMVVLFGGGVMALPWADKVKAILYMGLPGQAGGRALANLLTGRANPSGKLTETWPLSCADVVSSDIFGTRNPEYRESVYVGYRYYDRAEMKVRYPFGHGLSYASFAYDDLRVEGRHVSVRVTNTGSIAGAEVVQLYLAPPEGGCFRPAQELKGFVRLALAPGDSSRAEFVLTDRSFSLWHQGWKIPGGTYSVRVGASSRDIRLRADMVVDGVGAVEADFPAWQSGSWYAHPVGKPDRSEWEMLMGHPVPLLPEPAKGHFSMDNSCMEMRHASLVMRIQYAVTARIIGKNVEGAKDASNPVYRMLLISAVDCPLRATVINSQGQMGEALAEGLLHMANGHWAKALRHFLKRRKSHE